MTREAMISVREPGVAGMSELLERVAQSSAAVLVHGEKGVGKEVLARSLHAVSRRHGELVVVRCAGSEPAALASELFGASDRVGALEGAGTVLLDEIGEMPREVQDRLARTVERHPVCRLISTSHRRVPELVELGALREDLARHLSAVTLELLPLRERRSEIEGLAQELLVEAVRGTEFATTRFTPAALATLAQYDWPGNVRELQLVVSRAALLAGTAPIESHHLLLDRAVRRIESFVPTAPRDEFLAVAREHHGNASAIARRLHTSRSQVRRLASRFEVDLDQLRRALAVSGSVALRGTSR